MTIADYNACRAVRTDFEYSEKAISPRADLEVIGATWTYGGESRQRYVVVPRAASAAERDRQVDALLASCRRRIEARVDEATASAEQPVGTVRK